MKKIRAADLFCGAGGTSIGAHQTGEVKISFAVNHWDVAVQTHSKNFPKAKHVQQALKWVHPSEAENINLLFASPECTHHSRARGGRPTTDQQRSGAWELMPWIEHHRPSFIVVENVSEFQEWGPVDHKTGKPLPSMQGKFFDAWVMAIQSAGYKVDFRRLNAADYGAATSRERLFIVARKGRRSVCWPEPTHCKDNSNCLPGMELLPWRGAIEIIDWSIPLPSVFGRKRPLADKTLARIGKGLERHVAPMVASPLGTTTSSIGDGIACPMLLSAGGREVDARVFDGPMPTLLTHQNLAIACPMIVQFDNGSGVRVPRSASQPTKVLTTKAGQAVCVPFVTSFYGTQNTSPVDKPCPTITTVDRHAATLAVIGDLALPSPRTDAERDLQDAMKKLGVFDIGFRMLSNSELAGAQGFPLRYEFCGTKKEVTKQIGNSVSPPVARAMTEALLA